MDLLNKLEALASELKLSITTDDVVLSIPRCRCLRPSVKRGRNNVRRGPYLITNPRGRGRESTPDSNNNSELNNSYEAQVGSPRKRKSTAKPRASRSSPRSARSTPPTTPHGGKKKKKTAKVATGAATVVESIYTIPLPTEDVVVTEEAPPAPTDMPIFPEG